MANVETGPPAVVRWFIMSVKLFKSGLSKCWRVLNPDLTSVNSHIRKKGIVRRFMTDRHAHRAQTDGDGAD